MTAAPPPATPFPPPRRRPVRSRRGIVFVVALGIIVILTAVLFVFAREMRVEVVTSGYRQSAAQASAVELGAEQWVLSQVEANTPTIGGASGSSTGGTGTTDVTTIPAEALQVGGGYFWLLHQDPAQYQTQAYGIVDESGKVNLNAATSDQLLLLPGMTQEAADSLVAWAASDPSTSPPADAGDGSYYGGLQPEPYTLKSAAFETVEEALIVKGVAPLGMYGLDLNHDGVVDPAEQKAADAAGNGGLLTTGISTGNDPRGWASYVTVYSTHTVPGAAAVPGQRTIGLVNVNTAPRPVLLTLDGLQDTDADLIIAQRQTSASASQVNDTSWVSTAIGQTKYGLIQPYITGQSYQFSADIVAVSGDGRAFKRVKIVVDARAQPATIVYRRDLTSLGWPLPADVRDGLRAGKGAVTTNVAPPTG